MTTCEDARVTPCGCTQSGAAPDGCDECRADLPVNPFVALRVAYGMLLGEDDFRTMMGNPRGKQMLHNAWLHGSGVVWGYPVSVSGERMLTVAPGLALDGLGRELLSEATWCADVREWLVANKVDKEVEGCGHRTLHACLVARADCCLSRPVPTLSDPCDVTRKHDDWSRVVETVEISLVRGCCPCPAPPYHRLRVLLGLDRLLGDDDTAGAQALAAARAVAETVGDERARELERWFRELAALDAADLRPATEPGDPYPSLFGVVEDAAGVVLACVDIDVRDDDGCIDVLDVRPSYCCRRTLLPTQTIQELTCGLAPGMVGATEGTDAGGPRVIPDSLELRSDGRVLVFAVTAPLNPGSVRRAVHLTSLSDRGWVDEDIDVVRYDPDLPGVVVELADRPINDVVRLVVAGTGRTPVFGADPAVPLAGLVGGPPGTANDGHDAVLTFANPIPDRGADA